MSGLLTWVVYDKPLDFPTEIIARRWEGATATGDIIRSDDLDMVRHRIRKTTPGLIRFTRAVDDDPHIIEVWL